MIFFEDKMIIGDDILCITSEGRKKVDGIICTKRLFNEILQKAFHLQRQLSKVMSFLVSCGNSTIDGFYNRRVGK